jgi:hypothetical protein
MTLWVGSSLIDRYATEHSYWSLEMWPMIRSNKQIDLLEDHSWFWDMYTKPLALFWNFIKWQLGVDLACIVYTKPACVSVWCLDIHGASHVSMNRPHGWRGHGLLWLNGFQSSEVALQQRIRITWSPYLMLDCELVAELFGCFCFWLAEFIFWCEDRRSMHCERTQNCVKPWRCCHYEAV